VFARIYRTYGVGFGIRAATREMVDVMAASLPLGAEHAPSGAVTNAWFSILHDGGRGRYVVERDGEALAEASDLEHAAAAFEARVTLHVAEMTPHFVFMHAGVVAWRGHLLLFPGRSMSGKSTLVAEMVRAGGAYFSDEYAVIAPDGRVHPYTRPLQLRVPGAREQVRRSVYDIGGVPATGALAPSLVVLSRYRAGATWRPKRVSPGRAAFELLQHTMCAVENPPAAMDAVHRLAASVPVWRGVRGDVAQIIAFADRELAES